MPTTVYTDDQLEPMFQDVEELWVKLSGKEFRPMDWAFLESFFKAGIPLAPILKGIETSFRRFKPKFPGDRIRGLSYCAPEICRACIED